MLLLCLPHGRNGVCLMAPVEPGDPSSGNRAHPPLSHFGGFRQRCRLRRRGGGAPFGERLEVVVCHAVPWAARVVSAGGRTAKKQEPRYRICAIYVALPSLLSSSGHSSNAEHEGAEEAESGSSSRFCLPPAPGLSAPFRPPLSSTDAPGQRQLERLGPNFAFVCPRNWAEYGIYSRQFLPLPTIPMPHTNSP